MLHLLIESTSSVKTKLKQTYSIIFTKFVIFTPQKVEFVKEKKAIHKLVFITIKNKD